MMASANRGVMEKPNQEQQQQQQQALKCPRCDSSNTKFCYYNNYSQSQPRHFCKACKRYWTRGGTLRNVPVGGGCRKNKRVKRPAAADTPSNPTQIETSSSIANHGNPLFYGLPSNPSELNLPYPRFNDLQPQMNALGLGFSADVYRNGFTSNSSLLPSYSLFGSAPSSTTTATTTSTTAAPTMASLFASSFQQHKYNSLQALFPFQDLQMGGNNEVVKEVKLEEGRNRMEWSVPCQNQIEQIGTSDSSIYWLDPANIGSSVTSLI